MHYHPLDSSEGVPATLHITAATAIHRRLLDLCQPLEGIPGTSAVPAQRKARREYENRVNALATDTL
ncbi:hypothetical protein OHS33_37240 [Streptomyces sp. NBC_00536]|uniref:hypothetical protein n=1 Tax=Streptomyces sp. NBC_00536 TaxID=2975769 RepID=UPI002E7FE641|nr:hypothetical protein [Streptomyces sp. NBC_00536]WUC83508.1 hypothetical protein OHS33_37240 [Streptomyces sp. NBC_00536]